MFSFACYLVDIIGLKSYNINVSFHININPPRVPQRGTGVGKLCPFIFGVGNSIYTVCTYVAVFIERTNKPSICMVFAISKL